MVPGRRRFLVVLAGLLGAVAGCSGPPEVELVPVTGRVRFRDGRAVFPGIIEALPEGSGPSARGQLDSEGRFTLQTGARNGAVPGTHRIVIQQMIIADGGAQHVGRHTAHLVIHPKYSNRETSGLVRQVEAGQVKEWILEVEPAAEKRGW